MMTGRQVKLHLAKYMVRRFSLPFAVVCLEKEERKCRELAERVNAVIMIISLSQGE
jgi:hypothetical protein